MGLWYQRDSGFELTAFSDVDHAGCMILGKALVEGYSSLVIKLSIVDEATASKDIGFQLQQNTVVLRLSVSHSNLMQPRTTFTDKAHPYSLEVVEIVIPEVRGIDDDILLTIKDDILRKKLLNETNTFDNSSLESETVCFDLEENSSGSTTTRSDYSLPDYEAFYSDDEHIEEKSSDSTTTHADFSQYDSLIFDLLINPFPPTNRSDFYHEEFAGELAHIISPPQYDHFCFKNEPELGDFTMDMVEDIFLKREPRVHVPNVLPTHPTLDLDLDFILLSEPLFAYIVWIFLLLVPVAPLYLLSCGNEDTIFDPGISVYHSFMPGSSRALYFEYKHKRFDCPDSEASRARGFVLRSQELQILSFIWESNILILSSRLFFSH
ncbi:hypothetical protein Tco_0751828 [Tanacetum coccineum]|uniref:Uncharacterized protein n=1 Tax=Tanacetum coccineum TaxID=301880 RepID=A0ABQ4Z8C4_9ASTR